ncbi:MAG: hypothetical protein PT944_00790 [Actinomycetaceae bacterium]|nr:hypothetical protein [Arcanobacterium sp.]MDD7686444.1 hypothetical protein [Actinomycetaceae bacterium]MDY5272724.1 hypothetical protein [Arcanobacterium sp.]
MNFAGESSASIYRCIPLTIPYADAALVNINVASARTDVAPALTAVMRHRYRSSGEAPCAKLSAIMQ